MNTRQKLTLGIAAIFMVTLTIVGVTYAYFVTRVAGDGSTAKAQVTAVKLGDVSYVAGNEVTEGTDMITFADVQPGAVYYKTFAVKNEGEAESDPAGYTITAASSMTKIPAKVVGPEGQTTEIAYSEFIHTATGLNDGLEGTCYGVMTNNVTDGTKTVVEPKRSTEGGDAACFVKEGESYYNNIVLSLYSVGETAIGAEAPTAYTAYETAFFNDAAYMEGTTNLATAPSGDPITLANLKSTADKEANDITKLKYNGTVDISAKQTIAGQKIQYFVLKVEYVDAKMNQNAENLAGVDIIVSIKA